MIRFLTILLIGILAGAEVDLFIPSFPELQKVFNLTPFTVSLTLSVNFIAYCVCCLFAGTLGDRFDRRKVILISLLIFTIGSLLCVFATHYFMLITGRLFQGIGMAGPAVLSYVVLADETPLEKQPAMMGMLNGMTTVAMAFAPVVGSFVNLYFNWRGNFVILLLLSTVSLIASYFVIPSKKGIESVSLSPKAYLPLFYSPKLMTFVLGICFFIVPYWLFIGMSPILYMNDLHVPLKQFGFYQGAIALVFAVVSLSSPLILQRWGQRRCFDLGIGLCLVSTVLTLLLALFNIKNPILITCVMMIFAAAAVFPINILYPYSLEVLENTKGRTAALILSIRLIITAALLQTVSYFYQGNFFHLGIAMVILMTVSFICIYFLITKKWFLMKPA